MLSAVIMKACPMWVLHVIITWYSTIMITVIDSMGQPVKTVFPAVVSETEPT